MWRCMECGRKFKTAAAAERAAFGDRGCPKCGGSDIDFVSERESMEVDRPRGVRRVDESLERMEGAGMSDATIGDLRELVREAGYNVVMHLGASDIRHRDESWSRARGLQELAVRALRRVDSSAEEFIATTYGSAYVRKHDDV